MITNVKVEGTAIVRITQLTELTLKYARMDIRIKQFAKIM